MDIDNYKYYYTGDKYDDDEVEDMIRSGEYDDDEDLEDNLIWTKKTVVDKIKDLIKNNL